MPEELIPNTNIGVVGHVDHGKTTLVNTLTGVWTDRHSEEMKRGISIRLGYADAVFYRCRKCRGPEGLTTTPVCTRCDSETEPIRAVSFVDAPGHETLMATMLSGSALMDGAMLVISAADRCPQPQTKEHLMALELVGIKKIVIVQNKIDVVSHKEAIRNYEEIKAFVKGTIAENAPIIPVSAQKNINIWALIQALDEVIPEPSRHPEADPVMLIARSFDVNRPGCSWKDVKGGVVGGSLIRGLIEDGAEIEIRPGIQNQVENKTKWEPIITKVTEIHKGQKKVHVATPGGLLAIGTKLDPAITKSDMLAGQVLGHVGKLPPVWEKMWFSVKLMERVVGSNSEVSIEPLKQREPLMLSVGTAVTVGLVSNTRKDAAEVVLKRPVCASIGSPIAISRQVGGRWRLIGMGTLIE
ncbi:translation initiation factor 2 subunit gamma (aeIF-2g) [Methanospirillum hungatei JF-1]|uniref:protein-synthesizing GTPase n=1 Tax=Methanospirillum hungatei JF-1 (strain ATCC 27890 / DSM 864 / NBRC 100397 / JF-1) TaxID=323259 RepID=Q2FTN2_METHJ|nr:translation initiation factor IF-2 subunit gamma [Methanospirillum hungatei]MBP7034412.1 translation initiation factor IF-2 subunit gamma [Methanospirillum sp.]OQA59570.1 MAG: Translation initiation factor 2 subunit gamma [Euryarchaeota archaeon ADurb.Bin294]ABD42553.1 translation initiation factor 2 subunit gamma (aeIF-2g) [Methanospirillum hungatei JF-1]MBP9007929.1 translation initiation factor IF-2 subunit gamma [Methanospirillum sp.]HOW04702.1 translation initiation factor IF-2 subunit